MTIHDMPMKGDFNDSKTGQRGKWWQLSTPQLEEALMNWIKKTYGVSFPPREEVEVRLLLGDQCKRAEIVVLEKQKE